MVAAMTDVNEEKTKVAGALGDLLKGGGAADIVSKLGQHGLGDIASSWVGLGKNLPISADQISKVLGSGAIASIASKLGISTERATHSLAEVLPHAIDHMTPTGEPPAVDAEAPEPGGLMAKMFGG
ncbi:MAG: DUF937 domain-containing protein [Myxococcales bacterium]|nr:DUF937 domain-containing protein [Myxococcales bacterium]